MKLTDKDISRFWENVDIDSSEEGCWLWTGVLNGSGYGTFCFKGENKGIGVHRISFVLSGEIIPTRYIVRHKCRNRHCVNPEHLETGTTRDNMMDRVRDGTDARGEKCSTSKLKNNDILKIREWTGRKDTLAKMYGVSKSLITMICNRTIWKHI